MDVPFVPENPLPGQVFRVDQLPNPEAQKTVNVDPEAWRNNLGQLYVEGEGSHGLSASRSYDDVVVEAQAEKPAKRASK